MFSERQAQWIVIASLAAMVFLSAGFWMAVIIMHDFISFDRLSAKGTYLVTHINDQPTNAPQYLSKP